MGKMGEDFIVGLSLPLVVQEQGWLECPGQFCHHTQIHQTDKETPPKPSETTDESHYHPRERESTCSTTD